MKYIYTFSKSKQVQYVSHLDTLRVFERAMRRAKLPTSYSQGFHPHPLITFAQPLGVGVSSQGELVEIAFERALNTEEQERFRMAMPGGFSLLQYRENEQKSPFSALALAIYEIEFAQPLSQTVPEAVLGKDEIMMTKRSKKGDKQVNIRPMIRRLEMVEGSGNSVMRALLKAGEPSLKPELLIQAMEQVCTEAVPAVRAVCRMALLDETENPIG